MAVFSTVLSALTSPILKKLTLSDNRYEDVFASATSLGTGASAPDLVTVNSAILAYSFDGRTTLEQLYGAIEMPHWYKEGSDIEFHVHWMPTTSAATANVKWQLEYTWANKDTIFPASTTISAVVATATTAISKKNYIDLTTP